MSLTLTKPSDLAAAVVLAPVAAATSGATASAVFATPEPVVETAVAIYKVS